MSQEAFAAHLGISARTIAKWAQHPDAALRAATAGLLDAVLDRADESTRQRFTRLLVDRRTATPLEPASPLQPAPDAAVKASQERWRDIRLYLTEHGIGLARRTAELYDDRLRVGEVPALSTPAWLPDEPIPLDRLKLHWQADAPPPKVTGTEAEAQPTLPPRSPGHAFPRYTAAIRYLKPPALFENRHSYRLLDVDLASDSLTFGLSTFFDKLDVGEALGHEAALADKTGRLEWSRLAFRSLIADPFELAIRPVNPGISTLTIRREADGTGTFLLLARDPEHVTNGRHYSLLPAGEFQPASLAPESITADLDLWRNIAREYSEEVLGQPEHDGSSGLAIDYETWPFYRDFMRARETGGLRVCVLGVVLDALSLNASIATVAVIDAPVFDRLFKDAVPMNPEGRVISSLDSKSNVPGLPFEPQIVERLIRRERLGQTSAACLALAWRSRESLLS